MYNYRKTTPRNFKSLVLIGILALLCPLSLQAQGLIKLATSTPDNSAWNNSLYEIVEQIKERTSGRVLFKVYANGIAGPEREVLRKMRLGAIGAGIFSIDALRSAVPESLAMVLPYMVSDKEEFDRLREFLAPKLNERFRSKGLESLAWSFSGWLYLFSNRPILSPDQLESIRLGADPSEAELSQGWNSTGFQTIPVSPLDFFTALQSGMIESFYATPLVALAFQWFPFAKHMAASKIAPLVGNLIISRRVWMNISEADQQIVRDEVRKMVVTFEKTTTKQDAEALKTMKKMGLQEHPLSKEQEQAWIKVYREKVYTAVTGEGRSLSQELLRDIEQALGK